MITDLYNDYIIKTFQIEDILILHSNGYVLTDIILNDLYS
jgi:hypothetical protein